MTKPLQLYPDEKWYLEGSRTPSLIRFDAPPANATPANAPDTSGWNFISDTYEDVAAHGDDTAPTWGET